MLPTLPERARGSSWDALGITTGGPASNPLLWPFLIIPSEEFLSAHSSKSGFCFLPGTPTGTDVLHQL